MYFHYMYNKINLKKGVYYVHDPTGDNVGEGFSDSLFENCLINSEFADLCSVKYFLE